MGRLIDADKVIKKLNKMVLDNEWLLNQFNADFIESFIDEQPTAYDVEKVKQQIIEAQGVGLGKGLVTVSEAIDFIDMGGVEE